MKHLLTIFALLFLTAPAVHAQEPAMDDDRTMSMEQVMEAHEHLMADSLYHAHMMADTSLQAAMRDMMTPEMQAMHQKMMAMPHAERMAMMSDMHAQMREQMKASPESAHAFHEQMVAAHRRALTDPEVRERLMADPEMREMLERLHEDGMMDHDMMEGHHEGMEDHEMMKDSKDMDKPMDNDTMMDDGMEDSDG